MNMTYDEFLRSKMKTKIDSGFDVNQDEFNSRLFPFQKFILTRALKAGKFAIFADCGLGKTFMQLEWARLVYEQTGNKVLILAPLAVTSQTELEATKWGISLDGITILNYEQIDNIDCSRFGGIVLDESSILKNFEGKTKKKIIESFAKTRYKLACTATPAPNDPTEIGNHSEFLNLLPRSEMLAMYFVHDAGDTGEWRLKGHAIKHFYQWISTWAIMLSKPSDIGFNSPDYHLPSLNFIENQIETELRFKDGKLLNDVSISATNFNAELRKTQKQRIDLVAQIANSNDESFIIWIKHDEEGQLLKKMIVGSVEVKGSDPIETKKKNLIGFANGEFRVLITKAKIAQFGLNYQNCHNQIFASLDFSFESLYQAIRRSYRFGQKEQVNIYLITTDTMKNVIESINEKQKKFEMMKNYMSESISNYLGGVKLSELEYKNKEIKNEYYHIKNGDSIKLIKEVESESVGFSVFSPPFADLFTYSSHVEDLGNCKDYNEFVEQFKFLVSDLFRILKQGRNVAVHCMDLPIQKGKEGFIGLRDFSGTIRELFESVGFIYHSRITIWKDPVTEMQRTKALGLLHKQVKKDSTMSRVGIPDTVMVFRKDGERTDPVTNTDLSVELWQKYASPIWMDIDQGDTLNGRIAREEEDEKHLCPLQLPVIQRLIHLYTNPNDIVFTPFLGIGSEAYQAVKMGRRAIGFELKESYYDQAVANLKLVELEKTQGELF